MHQSCLPEPLDRASEHLQANWSCVCPRGSKRGLLTCADVQLWHVYTLHVPLRYSSMRFCHSIEWMKWFMRFWFWWNGWDLKWFFWNKWNKDPKIWPAWLPDTIKLLLTSIILPYLLHVYHSTYTYPAVRLVIFIRSERTTSSIPSESHEPLHQFYRMTESHARVPYLGTCSTWQKFDIILIVLLDLNF